METSGIQDQVVPKQKLIYTQISSEQHCCAANFTHCAIDGWPSFVSAMESYAQYGIAN